MRHSAYKREKDTFICANIQVINTILKVNKDNSQTLKCINHLLTFLSHCKLPCMYNGELAREIRVDISRPEIQRRMGEFGKQKPA